MSWGQKKSLLKKLFWYQLHCMQQDTFSNCSDKLASYSSSFRYFCSVANGNLTKSDRKHNFKWSSIPSMVMPDSQWYPWNLYLINSVGDTVVFLNWKLLKSVPFRIQLNIFSCLNLNIKLFKYIINNWSDLSHRFALFFFLSTLS